jgi:hypothetical protein
MKTSLHGGCLLVVLLSGLLVASLAAAQPEGGNSESTKTLAAYMNSDNRIPLVESLAKLMDGDAWYYEWPHGLLPLEPKGFDLVSGP